MQEDNSNDDPFYSHPLTDRVKKSLEAISELLILKCAPVPAGNSSIPNRRFSCDPQNRRDELGRGDPYNPTQLLKHLEGNPGCLCVDADAKLTGPIMECEIKSVAGVADIAATILRRSCNSAEIPNGTIYLSELARCIKILRRWE